MMLGVLLKEAALSSRWGFGMRTLIRPAVADDASTLAEAARKIAEVPGLLASQPAELQSQDFREKISGLGRQ